MVIMYLFKVESPFSEASVSPNLHPKLAISSRVEEVQEQLILRQKGGKLKFAYPPGRKNKEL